MNYFVYLIVTSNKNKLISYVGYTNNLEKRLKLHNSSKGAKFTKGRSWKIAYFKEYNLKKDALTEEYRLKKDYNLRKRIKKYFKENENICPFTI